MEIQKTKVGMYVSEWVPKVTTYSFNYPTYLFYIKQRELMVHAICFIFPCKLVSPF